MIQLISLFCAIKIRRELGSRAWLKIGLKTSIVNWIDGWWLFYNNIGKDLISLVSSQYQQCHAVSSVCQIFRIPETHSLYRRHAGVTDNNKIIRASPMTIIVRGSKFDDLQHSRAILNDADCEQLTEWALDVNISREVVDIINSLIAVYVFSRYSARRREANGVDGVFKQYLVTCSILIFSELCRKKIHSIETSYILGL